MKLKPMPPYFLIKIPIKKSESKGIIIVPDTLKFMAYNMQCGEVVEIGEDASEYFPEVKIGYTLIVHHFVEGNDDHEARVDHLVHSDGLYNYYVVTAFQFNGKDCETYGVWDGKKIIPNKDYIFLHSEEQQNKDLSPDEMINQALTKSESGLYFFKEWIENRETKEEKQHELKKQVESLSKSGVNKRHIQKGILEKEREMENISVIINKQKYMPFKVSYFNNELLKHFKDRKGINESETIYILNIAANTKVKFMDNEYVVAKTKYIAMIT
jgi:co-chaperonin GroES (HSP10)